MPVVVDRFSKCARAAAVVAALCLAFVGCSDDAPSEPDVAADIDIGPDAPLEDCTGVPIAVVVGDACGATDTCSDRAAECAELAGEDGASCRQLCIPSTCESVCQDTEECAPLAGSPGTGVCVPRPVGTVQAYEICTDPEPCADPYECLVHDADAVEGVCVPRCEQGEGCIDQNGRSGQCVVFVEWPSGTQFYCGPDCPTESDAECPGEMRCVDPGRGPHVCVF